MQVQERRPEATSCAEPVGEMPGKSGILDWHQFDAALFDLDGVITQSAQLHAKAWQETFDPFLKESARQLGERLAPFNIVTDYARYVDGKPRLDGIRSFLQSRMIDIPEGEADDTWAAMTINGLAKRKNAVFLKLLRGQGVSIYPDALALLDVLRDLGCRAAIISASRNCEAVLEATGLSGLFDVQIDGVAAHALNLRGKPAPDTFAEAARQLDVLPGRAVVIEDSIAGVAAGRAGGFGLVVGVDRTDKTAQLLAEGADHVVTDLMELAPDNESGTDDPVNVPPSALDQFDAMANRIGTNRVAVFLDYDGTVTPIVERPELALLDEGMRSTIRRLSELCPVIVMSGRELADVEARVGIHGIVYAGSHGFDIAAPDEREFRRQFGSEYVPQVRDAAVALKDRIGDINGVIIEDKTYAVAIHYRLADPARVPDIESAVDDVLARHTGLAKIGGKKVFELRPDIPWNKGTALLWLLEKLNLDTPDVTPIYIGDDVTDKDAFRVLAKRGISVLVAASEQTSAHYRLADPDEVRKVLCRLIDLLAGGGHG